MKINRGEKYMVKNQHYIPQFYLKRFGQNGKIDVYDIKNKKFIPNSNVSNFASKRFFYDIDTNKLDSELSILKKIYNVPDDDPNYKRILDNPQFIEETLSKVESNMSNYLDKIENDFSLITNEDFLSTFFIFIRTVSIRTSGYRETLEKITTQTTNWLKTLGITECSNYPLNIPPDELAKIEQLKYIISIPQTFKKSIDFFNNYNIYIGINHSDLGFIISNEPFISFELGFNDICFPINPNLSIIMQVKNVDENYLICKKKPNCKNIINLDVHDIVKYNIFQNHLISKYLFGNIKDIQNILKIISILNNIDI